jgi:hypothetical protein
MEVIRWPSWGLSESNMADEKTRRIAMPDLKLLVWNVEWMNDLFVSGAQPAAFKSDDAVPSHHRNATVRKRRDDLSGVIEDLSPDVVVLVEGPTETDELQLFFDMDVQGEWRAEVQPSPGMSQCLGVAACVDTDRFEDPPIERFETGEIEVFGGFLTDVDEDGIQEQYGFERKPVYAEVKPKEGRAFRVLGLHLKSKGIFTSYEWSKWWQIADANRRKILAQATQLRIEFLDPYLSADEGDTLDRLRRHKRRPWPRCQREAALRQRRRAVDGDGLETSAVPAQRPVRVLGRGRAGRAGLHLHSDRQLPGPYLQLHVAPGVDRPCPLHR